MPPRFVPRLPLRLALHALGFAVLCAAAACDDAATPASDGSIAALVASDSDFERLEEALAVTPLAATLSDGGPYTLFAPTDAAFEYLGEAELALLLRESNRDLLTDILRHHIVPGLLRVADLEDGQVLETLAGPVTVRRVGSTVFLGEARVDDAGRETTNGVVFPISAVLRDHLDTATRLRLAPSLSRFTDWAQRTGALATFGGEAPTTVFAPLDLAFERLSPDLVTFLNVPANADAVARLVDLHTVPGRVVLGDLAPGTALPSVAGAPLTLTFVDGVPYLDGHRVLTAPVETANGLLYLVDALFLDGLTLDQRVRIEPPLTTFAGFVGARPALEARLSSGAPTTVFAFTDAAWQSLPDDVRGVLQEPENAALFDRVVEVHVVPGRYETADLTDGLVLESLDGTPLTVRRSGPELFVGDRKVGRADLAAENGVLHLLDGVILPTTIDLLDTALLRGQTLYAAAVRRAGLESLLRSAGPLTAFVFENDVFNANPTLIGRPDLADILRYHLAGEALPVLEHGLVFASLEGTNRTIALDPTLGQFFLDGRAAIGLRRTATNGYFYVIDALTTPPVP